MMMRATLVLSLCKLGLVTQGQASSLRSRLDHATPLSVSSPPRMQVDPRTPSPRFPRQGQTGTTGPK